MSGWLVEQARRGNVHVIPAEQQGTAAEHRASESCWCIPRRSEEPDLMSVDVYLHRRSHDHGHRYTDAER